MKKVVALVFWLGLPWLGYAQSESEFGFVAKISAFQFSSGVKNRDWVYSEQQKHRLGQIYFLGVWQSWPLGNRFRVSAELLYGHGFLQNEQRSYISGFFGSPTIPRKVTQQITNSGIYLPVKLHYSFKKDGKNSLAFGAGASKIFTVVNAAKEEIGVPSTSDFSVQSFVQRNYPDDDLQFSFSAAFFHRIDAANHLSFEYTFERMREYGAYLFTQNFVSNNGDWVTNKAKINSFSVSLRHNILH